MSVQILFKSSLWLRYLCHQRHIGEDQRYQFRIIEKAAEKHMAAVCWLPRSPDWNPPLDWFGWGSVRHSTIN
jgi:hypothetical protein